MIKIKLLPAEYGECIMISVGEKTQYNILLDGGLIKTYQGYIKREIQNMEKLGQNINLMICTHMDNDHICGLIQVLKTTKSNFIEDVWYNGFVQMICNKFYSPQVCNFAERDNEIIKEIIEQGMILDEEQEVGINEGMSLGVLLQERGIFVNRITEGNAISDELIHDRIEIEQDTYISIIGPSRENIMKTEEYWKREMVSRNYMFQLSDTIKLTEAFEYQLERIKCIYSKESHNVSEIEGLEKYIGALDEVDESIVNRSSISFILEHKGRKFLFLGDAVVDEVLLKNMQNIVGFEYRFAAIKLPHHGSRYNITHEFISRYKADEYYCLTNSKKYGHPDLEVLATIICNDSQFKKIVFNYPIDKAKFLDKQKWKEKYNYEILIGDGKTVMERMFE